MYKRLQTLTLSALARCPLRCAIHFDKMGQNGERRKFSWGVSFSGTEWSFVFGVHYLWRHNYTSYSCFQRKK